MADFGLKTPFLAFILLLVLGDDSGWNDGDNGKKGEGNVGSAECGKPDQNSPATDTRSTEDNPAGGSDEEANNARGGRAGRGEVRIGNGQRSEEGDDRTEA